MYLAMIFHSQVVIPKPMLKRSLDLGGGLFKVGPKTNIQFRKWVSTQVTEVAKILYPNSYM